MGVWACTITRLLYERPAVQHNQLEVKSRNSAGAHPWYKIRVRPDSCLPVTYKLNSEIGLVIVRDSFCLGNCGPRNPIKLYFRKAGF